jgi:hypothetical protein
MRFSIISLFSLAALAMAQEQDTAPPILTISEEDMENVRPEGGSGTYAEQLVGNTIFAHSYRVRNNSLALPVRPAERSQQLNATHYFGPLVTEPVTYSNDSQWGSYIIFTAPELGSVVLGTSFAATEAALVVTGEDATCTGREGREDSENGAASAVGSVGVGSALVASAGLAVSLLL